MWRDGITEARLTAIRHQNDGLLETARELGMRGEDPFAFLCECDDPFCTDYIKLTLKECAALRADGGPILAPGHGPTVLTAA